MAFFDLSLRALGSEMTTQVEWQTEQRVLFFFSYRTARKTPPPQLRTRKRLQKSEHKTQSVCRMTQSGSKVLLNKWFNKELVGVGWAVAARYLITRVVYVCVRRHSMFLRSDVNLNITAVRFNNAERDERGQFFCFPDLTTPPLLLRENRLHKLIRLFKRQQECVFV